jgi:CRP/FNR family cyclic AMP-dependent transcriptional regulator
VVSINVEGIGEVARVANGEIVGEMSLLDQSLPFASVIVVELVDVLSIDHSKLEAKIESDPGFAARLYRAMAMLLSFRLRAAVQRPKDKRK